ncbi:MAG TPA: peroxidase family protein [Bryobacteraceae bacterium]|nr:peroxidase family protein [Bryobacteraceae bacterium]
MPPIFDKLTQALKKKRPWYELATVLAIPHLIRIRNDMRKKNLYDTEEPPLAKRPENEPIPPEHKDTRSIDGTYNDTGCPFMGAAVRRLGRNVPLEETRPDIANLLNPSPREVSRALMTRTEFQPAPILNLFAAAWIQFMVHDWFVHKNSDGRTIDVPLQDGDPWPANPMRIKATEPDAAPEGSTRPPAYINLNSHWWDASQVYGSDTETAKKLRTFEDGKLKLTESGRLFLDPDSGIEITGFTDNGWIGLIILHTLFAREHNAICDMLKASNPGKDDQWLYMKARLINAAILAKIHTVEWTTAILPHPTTQLALRTNWQGIAGEDLQEVFSFLDDSELLGGILGSTAEHHAAPYSLTEEFASVYRMHALMPDEIVIRSRQSGEELSRYTLPEVLGRKGCEVLDKHTFPDMIYSFGVSHPGAIRLHNYPKHLQDLTTDKGEHLDLATIDILRDRERGVPRYNRFRRLLGKEPVTSFEELTDNPTWREELRQLYAGDLEKVDLMVGLYAEPLPKGFGFSETAFRIFILMASRRLKSDRFFTDDFRPEIYTNEGIEWIKANGFASILKRHYPEVAAGLKGVKNPFAPWKTASAKIKATKA